MQLQEFEQREISLKKMNADIMSALTELNKKEDHSLRVAGKGVFQCLTRIRIKYLKN